ncbi:hypothetical protein M3Y99_00485100 [Aphelenchoides fujianensis]|nr:hypothetical protein M3Y99_00485100 [Aphelenchoides fujianensis]
MENPTESDEFVVNETKDHKWTSPVDRLAAAVRRLVSKLPIRKNEKQTDEEGRRNHAKSKLPAACGCALLALWFLFQFCFLLFLWCSSNGTPTVRPGPSIVVSPHADPSDSPATSTPATGDEYESDESGGLLALLKELNRNFDAEREQRTEGRAELMSRFDAQQSTILEMRAEIRKQFDEQQTKFERMQNENREEMRRLQAVNEEKVANLTATIGRLQEQIADLHRVNISIAPISSTPASPNRSPKVTSRGLLGKSSDPCL